MPVQIYISVFLNRKKLIMPMDKNQKMDFEKLLDISVKIHGHLCPGQVLGVRMSMLGLS